MLLNSLSNNQKAQLRNAFTLIDGDSKDSKITKDDLINIHQTLGMKITSKEADKMLDGDSINFAQFSNIMAEQLSVLDDRETIFNALKVFSEGSDVKDLIIDVEQLKESVCSTQLGDIGSGDHRLSRSTFDGLVKGFIKETSDGRKLFMASNWLDAYVD
ncbi:myosin light chain 2 [[Candida] jaroonii]|uniref:Myosin light chain 2 n=1 Tax=[Candida] jaroonii TaxID=467808 RepID=A0ACA9Y6P6_9ASCO|nr:myosin light chain 2 [[Candida] jaroonii]